jgi:hypothetical protein
MLLLKPNSYANAEGWDDLVHALTESNHSSLDEMILLVYKGIPGPYKQRPKYVRLVSYNRLDEVPKLLLSVAPSALRKGRKRHVEMPQEGITNGTEAGVEMSVRDYEQEIDEIRDPLACVLECLDAIKAFAESEKREAKRRRTIEGGESLQELTEALNQHRCDGVYCTLHQGSNKPSSKLLKKTIALRKKLSLSSKFHEGRSVSDLQHEILEVKTTVESLDNIPGSIETRDRIKKCWDEGCKRIFEK